MRHFQMFENSSDFRRILKLLVFLSYHLRLHRRGRMNGHERRGSGRNLKSVCWDVAGIQLLLRLLTRVGRGRLTRIGRGDTGGDAHPRGLHGLHVRLSRAVAALIAVAVELVTRVGIVPSVGVGRRGGRRLIGVGRPRLWLEGRGRLRLLLVRRIHHAGGRRVWRGRGGGRRGLKIKPIFHF